MKITTVTLGTDGSFTEATQLPEESELRHLQRQVGGYIEVVSLAANLDLYVDEDGMAKRLEPNFLGTLIADAYGFNQGSPLLGPVVFTGGVNRAGNTKSLDATQVELLRGLANRAAEVMEQ
jgi:hypothetical protein